MQVSVLSVSLLWLCFNLQLKKENKHKQVRGEHKPETAGILFCYKSFVYTHRKNYLVQFQELVSFLQQYNFQTKYWQTTINYQLTIMVPF